MTVIDLFAGAGGWDIAARRLGVDPLGIEWDEDACATREAAGLRTLHADVAALAPFSTLMENGGPGDGLGLIASPPCQSFSMAGKRGGAKDTQHVVACAQELAQGRDTRREHAEKCEDPRSMLVVEPVRWVADLMPAWIALEQVPPVLDLWKLFGQIFEGWSYKVWTDILSSERFGVPQTRKRAILMAHIAREVSPPEPTHQAYVPGEPARHESTLFGELLPWVSMSQALGWGMTERPSNTLVTRDSGGGAIGSVLDGGTGARRMLALAQESGEWTSERHGDRPSTPDSGPAPTISGKVRSASWLKAGSNANDVSRAADQPAATLRFGERMNAVEWTSERPAPSFTTTARSEEGGTIRGTTGDRTAEAVRVSIQEASVLQSFPADWPWQGSKSKQYLQCGNAIPVLLAHAILSELL